MERMTLRYIKLLAAIFALTIFISAIVVIIAELIT